MLMTNLTLRLTLRNLTIRLSAVNEKLYAIKKYDAEKKRNFLIYNINQLMLKCTTPTPIVLNASPDVTTP